MLKSIELKSGYPDITKGQLCIKIQLNVQYFDYVNVHYNMYVMYLFCAYTKLYSIEI